MIFASVEECVESAVSGKMEILNKEKGHESDSGQEVS